MARRLIRLASLCLIAVLAACGGQAIQGVVSVEILGGDRTVALGTTSVLTPHVIASSGVDTSVLWSSSDDAIAQVDASGSVTTHSLGNATITATSAADSSRTDAVIVTVRAPTVADDSAFMASVTMPTGFPTAVAAGMLFLDDEPIEITMASVVQVDDNFWAGPVGPVGADGAVIITLPPASDLPSEVMATAETFLVPINGMASCELVASVPSANVTLADFLAIALPGVVVYTSEGAVLALVTNQPLDLLTPPTPDLLATLEIVTWVYSDTATSISSVGDDCSAGDDGPTIGVAVDLVEGWNQLSWTLDVDEGTPSVGDITLGNSQASVIHVQPFAP